MKWHQVYVEHHIHNDIAELYQHSEDLTAMVWKDPKRFGWRGKWSRVEWFFMPSAESAMSAIEREMDGRR